MQKKDILKILSSNTIKQDDSQKYAALGQYLETYDSLVNDDKIPDAMSQFDAFVKPAYIEILEQLANKELEKPEYREIVTEESDLHSQKEFEEIVINKLSNITLDPNKFLQEITSKKKAKGNFVDKFLSIYLPLFQPTNFKFAAITKENINKETIELICVLQHLADKYMQLYKGEDLLNKITALERYFLANSIKISCKELCNENKGMKIIFDIEHIGFCFGFLSGLIYLKNPEIQELHRSILSSKNVNKGRYTEKNAELKDALQIAENSYNQGDDLSHNKMTDYILNLKNEDGTKMFNYLTRDRLMKEIKPITKKHGIYIKGTKKS